LPIPPAAWPTAPAPPPSAPATSPALDDLAQDETPETLRAMADDFQGSESEQGVALGKQVGATQTIPQILTKGRTAVKAFNSLFNNRYKDNAEILATWKSVSRIRKTGGGGSDDAAGEKPVDPPK
jgi:hypothetical protein